MIAEATVTVLISMIATKHKVVDYDIVSYSHDCRRSGKNESRVLIGKFHSTATIRCLESLFNGSIPLILLARYHTKALGRLVV